MTKKPLEGKIIPNLCKDIVSKQDRIILEVMKIKGITDVDFSKITREIHSLSGKEKWLYNGAPFIEIHPFEYTEIVLGGGKVPDSYKLTASQKIKVL